MEIRIDENNIAHLDTYISSDLTDSHYMTRVSAYQNFIQEAAAMHAAKRGVGIPELQEIGQTWVIARSRMEAYRYGRWMEDVRISTYAEDPQGLNCPRVIAAEDGDGNALFKCMTKWAIIDVNSGRPVRPTVITNALATPPKKMQEAMQLPNLVTFRETCQQVLFTYDPKIHYLDTDYNHHVNNRSYTAWCLEALPNDFNDAYKPVVLDIKWVRQSFRTDSLTVIVKGEDEATLKSEEPKLFFEIIRKEADGSVTTVFEAWSEWKRRELLS